MGKPGEDVVVFIIGMRINKWWALHQWLPVFFAMGPMLRELYTHKELGFLSTEMSWNFRTITLIQYWKSYENLIAYAKGPIHLKAWRNFYQKSSKSTAVGIFHETYKVPSGSYESLYANMPNFGLAKAIGHHPVTSKHNTSEQRIKA